MRRPGCSTWSESVRSPSVPPSRWSFSPSPSCMTLLRAAAHFSAAQPWIRSGHTMWCSHLLCSCHRVTSLLNAFLLRKSRACISPLFTAVSPPISSRKRCNAQRGEDVGGCTGCGPRKSRPSWRRERHCLSTEGSGNARQRHCLSMEGRANTTQRQCLSRKTPWKRRASALVGRRLRPKQGKCFFGLLRGHLGERASLVKAERPDLYAHRDPSIANE